jgi:hypothetical protein
MLLFMVGLYMIKETLPFLRWSSRKEKWLQIEEFANGRARMPWMAGTQFQRLSKYINFIPERKNGFRSRSLPMEGQGCHGWQEHSFRGCPSILILSQKGASELK